MSAMTKKTAIIITILAAIVVAVVAIVRNTSSSGEKQPLEPDPVKRRMADPKYVAALEYQLADRKAVMQRIDACRQKLAKAKEEKADEAVIKQLEAELAKEHEAFELNRQTSMALVRQRMQRDAEDDRKAAAEGK